MLEDAEFIYMTLVIILFISAMVNVIFFVELKNKTRQLGWLGRRLTSVQQHHFGSPANGRPGDERGEGGGGP